MRGGGNQLGWAGPAWPQGVTPLRRPRPASLLRLGPLSAAFPSLRSAMRFPPGAVLLLGLLGALLGGGASGECGVGGLRVVRRGVGRAVSRRLPSVFP